MADLLIISPSGSLTGDKTFAGAKATFFDAGTTTPATVYANDALTIPHASPLVAGADGLWPEIFVGGASFKAVVVYSDDTTCYTLDPCPKSQALGSSANLVSFSPTTALPRTNVQSALNLIGTAALVNTGTSTGNVPVLDANGKIPVTVATSSVGTAPIYGARAWVNFNGSTMAIRGSGNVSSVTKNATGDYSVSFSVSMPSANFSVVAIAGASTITAADIFRGMVLKDYAAGFARVVHCRSDGVAADATEISVVIFA